MVPKFTDDPLSEEAELLCPSCGGNYLHHERVEVYDCAEDANRGLVVMIEGKKAEIRTTLEGNPSRRRHVYESHFRCELCSAKPVFALVQHKGQTLLEMSS